MTNKEVIEYYKKNIGVGKTPSKMAKELHLDTIVFLHILDCERSESQKRLLKFRNKFLNRNPNEWIFDLAEEIDYPSLYDATCILFEAYKWGTDGKEKGKTK